MHVTSLELNNWGPYKGSHAIELVDTVYAVVAESEDDPERSNWIGKSWFLGAIRFLLTGVKPDSAPNEDGWITWGEREGSVSGTLSDGTMIQRYRKRGHSTQLEVTIPGQAIAKQDHAQHELERLIGMDHADLMATCFIEQRQIARLILSDPAERTKIINGWMELEPLQKAEAWLKARLLHLLDEERANRVTDGVEMIEGLEAVDWAVRATDTAEHVAALELERTTLAVRVQKLDEWEKKAELAASFANVQERGKALKAKTSKVKLPDVDQLDRERDRAALEKGEARTNYERMAELRDDQWDGTCPKTCEACPVSDQVKAATSGMRFEAGMEHAEHVLDMADAVFREADERVKKARTHHREHEQDMAALERMRDQAEALLDAVDFIEEHGQPPNAVDLRERLAILDGDIALKRRELVTAQANVRIIETREAEAVKKRARLVDIQAETTLHREAIALVGRQGAQKEIAEAVLADIEARANTLLQAAGIDLVVGVSWAREGKGLASHCDTCGAAFPKTTSAKECGVCGGTRGAKLVEKLQILPNDRSGAADDIAGLAFQLAASFWLRSKRMAPWSVACIDEPFGQLDRSNSRALSAHMHTLIRGSYAFEQGFLVAHDAAIMEALPSSVRIKRVGKRSIIEVV